METVVIALFILILVVFFSQKAINLHKLERTRLEQELLTLRADFMQERSRAIKAEEMLYSQKQKQAEQEIHTEELQQRFKLEFKNIANQILEEKTLKFTDQNRINMDIILNPLKENIKTFEEKVERVYKAESDERNVLKGVIGQLMSQTLKIQEDATNLTRALKGDNKKQGNWGEVILERILESSGLLKDREYRIQNSLTGSEGNRLQPDVIIDLPDHKHLVIDSKVSLLAYEQYVNAETEADRIMYLKQHILSIKNHILGLSTKNYQNLHQIHSPDFVILFIPIESSFGLAVQQDAELFNYAWDKKVVVVSPSTLLATLRTIASIWKQERQNKNVLEIARLSGTLYDKFVGFITDMEGIGKNIRQSQDAYDKAMNKLHTGTGNLSATSEKIKNLGAKTNKQLDSKYLDTNFND